MPRTRSRFLIATIVVGLLGGASALLTAGMVSASSAAYYQPKHGAKCRAGFVKKTLKTEVETPVKGSTKKHPNYKVSYKREVWCVLVPKPKVPGGVAAPTPTPIIVNPTPVNITVTNPPTTTTPSPAPLIRTTTSITEVDQGPGLGTSTQGLVVTALVEDQYGNQVFPDAGDLTITLTAYGGGGERRADRFGQCGIHYPSGRLNFLPHSAQ